MVAIFSISRLLICVAGEVAGDTISAADSEGRSILIKIFVFPLLGYAFHELIFHFGQQQIVCFAGFFVGASINSTGTDCDLRREPVSPWRVALFEVQSILEAFGWLVLIFAGWQVGSPGERTCNCRRWYFIQSCSTSLWWGS